ncbi:MAG: AzlD domain-containing protein [Desulfovibrionales bacterium]
MDQELIFATILGMAVVTAGPRIIPLLALKSRSLSPLLTRWLGFVPAAVLAAMLAPALLLNEAGFDFSFANLFFWASLPVFALALRTKSLFGSVLLGMGLVAAGRYFLG